MHPSFINVLFTKAILIFPWTSNICMHFRHSGGEVGGFRQIKMKMNINSQSVFLKQTIGWIRGWLAYKFKTIRSCIKVKVEPTELFWRKWMTFKMPWTSLHNPSRWIFVSTQKQMNERHHIISIMIQKDCLLLFPKNHEG